MTDSIVSGVGEINERVLLKIYNLPTHYAGVDYKDTTLTAVKQEYIKEKINNAPKSGMLVVQGNAAPIVRQLIKNGRKVRGANFVNMVGNIFEKPQLPKADVIVILGVGDEVTTNNKLPAQFMQNMLKTLKGRGGLVIIESSKTKKQFEDTYGVVVSNFFKIEDKKEDTWV